MNEDKIELLELALISMKEQLKEMQEYIKRSLLFQYEISRFRKKRKAEREIKKLLKYELIPILQKIDLKRLDVWYDEKKSFGEAVQKIKEALTNLNEWGY